MSLGELQQAVHLCLLRRVRQPPRPARGERGVRDSLRSECEAEAGTHGCDAAGDRRRGELPSSAPELDDPIREDLGVHVVESELAPVEPAGECGEVRAVRPLARLREPSVLEKAVDCRGRVHELGFALGLE